MSAIDIRLHRSNLSRLRERRFRWYDHLVFDRQYGFRTGRSTDDVLMLKNNVADSFVNEYVLGIFVDFKGIFDYLSHLFVLSKLRYCGCQELALQKTYLHGRETIVQHVWANMEGGGMLQTDSFRSSLQGTCMKWPFLRSPTGAYFPGEFPGDIFSARLFADGWMFHYGCCGVHIVGRALCGLNHVVALCNVPLVPLVVIEVLGRCRIDWYECRASSQYKPVPLC